MHIFTLVLCLAFGLLGVLVFCVSFNVEHTSMNTSLKSYKIITPVDWGRISIAVVLGIISGACYACTLPSTDVEGVLLVCAAAAVVTSFCGALASGEGGVFGTGFVLALVLSLSSCFTDTSLKRTEANERAHAAQVQADATPHVVHTLPNGCQQWAFKASDYWHYSLVCPHSTSTTDSAHGESYKCGKSTCTKTVYEANTFENP